MISEHISKKEATFSATATRKGIDNTPGEYELQNMELIAEKVFEPLRKAVNGPIKINSFFRSEELNKAIGGSSQITTLPRKSNRFRRRIWLYV